MYKGIVFGLAASVCFVGGADAADGVIVRKVSGENGFLTPEQLCGAKQCQDVFSRKNLHESKDFVWSLVRKDPSRRPEGSTEQYWGYRLYF